MFMLPLVVKIFIIKYISVFFVNLFLLLQDLSREIYRDNGLNTIKKNASYKILAQETTNI